MSDTKRLKVINLLIMTAGLATIAALGAFSRRGWFAIEIRYAPYWILFCAIVLRPRHDHTDPEDMDRWLQPRRWRPRHG
jgi:hypothetical protein